MSRTADGSCRNAAAAGVPLYRWLCGIVMCELLMELLFFYRFDDDQFAKEFSVRWLRLSIILARAHRAFDLPTFNPRPPSRPHAPRSTLHASHVCVRPHPLSVFPSTTLFRTFGWLFL